MKNLAKITKDEYGKFIVTAHHYDCHDKRIHPWRKTPLAVFDNVEDATKLAFEFNNAAREQFDTMKKSDYPQTDRSLNSKELRAVRGTGDYTPDRLHNFPFSLSRKAATKIIRNMSGGRAMSGGYTNLVAEDIDSDLLPYIDYRMSEAGHISYFTDTNVTISHADGRMHESINLSNMMEHDLQRLAQALVYPEIVRERNAMRAEAKKAS